MLLTVTTTHQPATDLGFLLHKHPNRAQAFPLGAGRRAHVFYPVATDTECTAALLLDVDPIAPVRDVHDRARGAGQYVNDRPYAAGSLLAVAIGSVYRSAMNGLSELDDLAATPIPLTIHIPAVPARGGAELVHRLFAPLGWQVDAHTLELDPQFPDWGESPYVDLRLTGTLRLADALKHIYVLLPVLDDAKHYWITEDEVAKLLRAGEGWLAEHLERELISRRYLRHRRNFVQTALERLAEVDGSVEDELDTALAEPVVSAQPDRPEPLAVLRRDAVVEMLKALGAQRVIDMGCGGGALLRELLKHAAFTEILGVDVSAHALEAAARVVDRAAERVRQRVSLRQSALTYVDRSLAGYDAAVLMEVIEHVDPWRLPALERCVFGAAKPRAVIVTTPNVEYNVRFETLPAGHLRHPDHRFEWTRAQFGAWADAVAATFGYTVRYVDVGHEDSEVGPPTQAAVFEVAR